MEEVHVNSYMLLDCNTVCIFVYSSMCKQSNKTVFLLSTWEARVLCVCETLKRHYVVGKCFYNHTMMVGC